jgi:hypothetical protein
MDMISRENAVTPHRVSMRRPMTRYWIVAGGCLAAWWCYQAGQTEVALVALLWGASEF